MNKKPENKIALGAGIGYTLQKKTKCTSSGSNSLLMCALMEDWGI